MAEFVCENCERTFLRDARPTTPDRKPNRFCSRSCADIWKRTAYLNPESERQQIKARRLLPKPVRAERVRSLYKVATYRAFGEEKTIRAWSEDEKCLVDLQTVRGRIKSGWSVEDALSTEARGQDTLTAFDETKTAKEWAKDPRVSVSTETWRARIFNGWDVEKALTVRLHMGTYGEDMADVKRVPLDKLQNEIIKPGIEKHLIPLLGYTGSLTLGRAHRLWNLTLAMKAAEVESITQAYKLQLHPEFAHLCEPERPVAHAGLYGFWSRIKQTQQVNSLEPGLTDFLESLWPGFYRLTKVAAESRWPTTQFWRTYVGRPRPLRLVDTAPRALFYPYLIHKPKESGGEWDMLVAINSAVPRGLPDHIRADVCQDICVAILAGEMTIDDLKEEMRGYIRKVTKMHPLKYGDVSWDAVISGDDDRTFGEVYSAERQSLDY